MVLEYEFVVGPAAVVDIGINEEKAVEEGEGKGVLDDGEGQSIER
jgi:hypothetical protein